MSSQATQVTEVLVYEVETLGCGQQTLDKGPTLPLCGWTRALCLAKPCPNAPGPRVISMNRLFVYHASLATEDCGGVSSVVGCMDAYSSPTEGLQALGFLAPSGLCQARRFCLDCDPVPWAPTSSHFESSYCLTQSQARSMAVRPPGFPGSSVGSELWLEAVFF